ncbi:nuclear transport factor 2 family protein [Streptomyces sp. NPDC051985]|uniref:nuclear transport factor 2 family protein n=1 Tax=Streptomyces sp. NPDC051985 TaxID=3155807 RepID=UPI003437070A
MTSGTEVGRCEVTGQALAELLAERDIRNQIHNYARAQDRFDTDLFLSVCHPDCVIDYGGKGGPDKSSPREAIEIFNNGHTRFASHLHFVSNITIKVVGDRAVSETYVHAVLRTHEDEDGKSTNLHARGRYLDRWSRRDGRWAMDQRLLVHELTWRDEAVDGRRGGQGGPTRDRDDPVYAAFAALDGATA